MRSIVFIAAFFYFTSAHASSEFTETAVSAPGPRGALRGTMLSPRRAEGPAILIVPGSGPTDRDGNNPLGIKAYTYKLLAEGLAARGITSIRIDKRGMFGSQNAVSDANAVTITDYANDVHSWIRAIRTRTGLSCVWVAGHSEGGLVAIAASRDPAGICGLVLLASPGRPAGEVLREQLSASVPSGPIRAQAFKILSTLEAGRHTDGQVHPALLTLFRPEVQGFVISLLAVDPARTISGFDKPVLIVQGKRDLQVSTADAERLARAAPHAKLLLLPDANHVLKSVNSSDKAENLASYAKPRLPLADGAAGGIADFLRGAPAAD
jgi:pimeloyl-ACP methyl ester carboxylesterase